MILYVFGPTIFSLYHPPPSPYLMTGPFSLLSSPPLPVGRPAPGDGGVVAVRGAGVCGGRVPGGLTARLYHRGAARPTRQTGRPAR